MLCCQSRQAIDWLQRYREALLAWDVNSGHQHSGCSVPLLGVKADGELGEAGETHRPLKDPEGVRANGGGKVGRAVQAVQCKVLAADEGVARHVAGIVGLISKGEGKAEQVESERRRAGVDKNQHRNMASEAGTHAPNRDLRAHVCSHQSNADLLSDLHSAYASAAQQGKPVLICTLQSLKAYSKAISVGFMAQSGLSLKTMNSTTGAG